VKKANKARQVFREKEEQLVKLALLVLKVSKDQEVLKVRKEILAMSALLVLKD
jgi:hypothetical protein